MKEKEGGGAKVRISVRAKPNAKRSAVLAAEGREIKVALAAPPVDGAANDELVALLSEVLGLPKRAIALARGASSKSKLVDVEGLDEAEIVRRLSGAASTRP